jgi:RimJ/RimL family protein N-acetyltransferase
MSLPIETTRLVLRRYSQTDLPDLLDCVSDPSVAIATPDIGTTPESVAAYIKCQNAYQLFEQGKCFDLAIELKTEKNVIGLLSFVRKENEQAEVGYALHAQYRGQGFATEAVKAILEYAFRVLKLHRVQADTLRGCLKIHCANIILNFL